MDRRKYLALAGSGLTLSIAGCTGEDAESGDNTTGDNNGSDGGTDGDEAGDGSGSDGLLSIGDSVTSDGLEISVIEYDIAREYTEVLPGGDEGEIETASSGAVFLFVKISVTHDGETAKIFPGTQDVDAFYLGEKVDIVETFDGPNYRVGGTIYTRYANALDGADLEGVFPGTEVQGWVVFEMPENFDQTETEIEIEDTEFSEVGRTYRWRLSE
jgi:hypothetical protein